MKYFYHQYQNELELFIDQAINEDLGEVDHSSKATISKMYIKEAVLIVKENCSIAGVELSKQIFKRFDPTIEFRQIHKDGDKLNTGDQVFVVKGKAISILAMERIVLNCMQRMSGTATLTNKLVTKISHTNCVLLDTRKTTPNFRYPQKWAVLIGGGSNHRMGLFDELMIKDNHIDYCGGISEALEKTEKYISKLKTSYPVVVETRSILEVKEALKYSWIERILLDNMDIDMLLESISLVGNKFPLEASGNINESNIVSIAETGVNYVSMGCLTHSSMPIDLSLKVFNN